MFDFLIIIIIIIIITIIIIIIIITIIIIIIIQMELGEILNWRKERVAMCKPTGKNANPPPRLEPGTSVYHDQRSNHWATGAGQGSSRKLTN